VVGRGKRAKKKKKRALFKVVLVKKGVVGRDPTSDKFTHKKVE